MRHGALWVALVATMAAGCFPGAPRAKVAKARIVPCRRAVGKINVDAKLDESAWERAYVLDDFRIPPDGKKPRHPSCAQLLWDDENLYLAMVMEDFDVFGIKKERDSWTWEDDVAELFLKPSDVEPAYYEIEVNPLGTVLDLLFGRRLAAGSMDRWKDWDCGAKIAVAISGTLNNWKDRDKGWILEMAVPWKAFAGTAPRPQLGDRWRFAVCRYDYSVHLDEGKELTSSAPLSVLDFHQFEDYDILEFSE